MPSGTGKQQPWADGINTPPAVLRGSDRQIEPQVFCIGFNKTGTTSASVAFEELGYRVGKEPDAERLISDWARRDFSRIIKYCLTAAAFQDVPFSLGSGFISNQAIETAAYVERYNRTVRNEWLDQYIIESNEEAQEQATKWLWTYNNHRPNMGIGGITPAMKMKMAA